MTGSRVGPTPHGPAPDTRTPGTRTTRSPAPGERRIALLTGGRGAGKTTVCTRLLARARDLGLDCAGIVSPARFDSGTKVGIDVLDVRSGERRALAAVDGAHGTDGPAGPIRLGLYRFDSVAIAWARGRLEAACPCDVLVVDEIGPLELERGEGWVNALRILCTGDYRLAVVVVRPSLLSATRVALADLPRTIVVERSVEADADPDPAGSLLVSLATAGPGETPPLE